MDHQKRCFSEHTHTCQDIRNLVQTEQEGHSKKNQGRNISPIFIFFFNLPLLFFQSLHFAVGLKIFVFF